MIPWFRGSFIVIKKKKKKSRFIKINRVTTISSALLHYLKDTKGHKSNPSARKWWWRDAQTGKLGIRRQRARVLIEGFWGKWAVAFCSSASLSRQFVPVLWSKIYSFVITDRVGREKNPITLKDLARTVSIQTSRDWLGWECVHQCCTSTQHKSWGHSRTVK